MHFEATPLTILILGAMFEYFLATVFLLLDRGSAGRTLYLGGFVLSLGAVALRWLQVGHVPMQNLFEVFLVMGTLVYPISLVCRRILRVGGETIDAGLGLALLFPVAFGIFPSKPLHLPPALQSPLFIPHVAAYLLAYVLLAKAGVQAFAQLIGLAPQGESVEREPATYRMAAAGFPLLTLGLVLGAWWGKLAWGDYWGWDPKELWSLATWLVFLGYFHFRYVTAGRWSRINSLLVLCGVALIVVTLLWANLAERFVGLHNYA